MFYQIRTAHENKELNSLARFAWARYVFHANITNKLCINFLCFHLKLFKSAYYIEGLGLRVSRT